MINLIGPLSFQIDIMLERIDHRYISIAGHAVDIISMVGIYYCCRDKEPWWALAITPMIVVPWLLIKAIMDRRRATVAAKNEEKDKHIASQPPPPTLKWLNNLIEVLWKTHRSFANQGFMEKIWPAIEEEVCSNSRIGCTLVGLKEFDIGSHPLKILNLSSFVSENGDEVLLQMEVTCESDASITLEWLPIPVTVRNIRATGVNLGLIIKGLSPLPSFIMGFQIFLLGEPDITWETAGMAKMTDIPGIESLVDYLIEEKIRAQLVLPSRILIPLELPEDALAKMRDMGLNVPENKEAEEDASHQAPLSVPTGVVQVTVIEAKLQEKTDFGFKHWAEFRTRGFSFTDLLPKANPGDPYAMVKIVHMERRSPTINNTLHPKWNFVCEFEVDLAFVPANLEIKVLDEDINIPGVQSDDDLGQVTESIATIRNAGEMDKWYNLEGGEGRIHLKLRWISQIEVE